MREPPIIVLRSALLAGAIVVAPLEVLAESHPLAAGKAIYERNCIVCHAADGTGAMAGIADLTKVLREPNREAERLLTSITNGVESSPIAMPPMGGDESLSKADARLVLDYLYRTFGGSHASPTITAFSATSRGMK